MRRIILIFMITCLAIYGFKFEKYPHNFSSGITIKSIKDGDTFDVKYLKATIAIRLYGIDTPEIRTKSALEKKYAEQAKEFLSNQLTNKNIYIEAKRKGLDSRQDSIVEVGQGVNNKKLNLNEELLRIGLAIVSEDYCNEAKYYDKWIMIQEEAKKNKVGFWSDKNYYPEIEAMIKKNRKQTEKKEQAKLKAVKK